MKRTQTASKDLEALITRLQRERQQHVDAIAEIDALFARVGIRARGSTSSRRGRRPSKHAAVRRSGGGVEHNAKFVAWAQTIDSWSALAKKIGVSYPTALALRDGRVPRAKVRAKIAKASGGAVPEDSW